MEFLKELGISNLTVKYLNDNLSKDEIEVANLKVSKIFSSIKYFREIGVTVIEELLIRNFRTFLCGRKRLEYAMSHINKDLFVQGINKDINYINELEKHEYL